MAEIKKLLEGYQRFYQAHFVEDNRLYKSLATVGQFPKTLVIACSDSRVDPSIIMDAGPGDIFVIRNVANLVPPYQPDSAYHGTSAALEFGINHLKVKNVVIMGHSGCAGIKTLLESDAPSFQSNFIHAWVNIAQEAKEATCAKHTDLAEGQTMCEQEAVLVSMKNLKSFPWISDKMEAGDLTLHGWHFSIDDGILRTWNEDSKKFQKVPV